MDIKRIPTRQEALLRIYKGRCVLNATACKLLEMPGKHPRVRILFGYNSIRIDRTTVVYIGGTSSSRGFAIKMRGMTARIDSAELSKRLASALNGLGTYRICPEVCHTEDSDTAYEIFFRPYPK